MERTHTRPEINALLAVIDCYVSLHRSEGFGLGPAEAMCLGKPTIVTNYSGSTDYMTATNCKPVDYELVEIEEDYGPYKAGLHWAEPDIEQAAAAMRDLVADPELVKTIGVNALQTIENSFSPAAVGKLITARLQQIRGKSETNQNRRNSQ
jgi:glycosyltransferase involved in cell wall biosynthesis